MVKVREFCCGCSLRSGTFSIAWGSLIYSGTVFLYTVYQFIYLDRRVRDPNSYYYALNLAPPSPYIFAYNVLRAITGIAVSITALWALHKNNVKFLSGLFWYLCYVVISNMLDEVLLIFEPSWEKKLTETNPYLQYYSYDALENIINLIVVYLFMAGFASYFALIVKSYSDYSLRNDAQNVEFVGPDATTVGYIAA